MTNLIVCSWNPVVRAAKTGLSYFIAQKLSSMNLEYNIQQHNIRLQQHAINKALRLAQKQLAPEVDAKEESNTEELRKVNAGHQFRLMAKNVRHFERKTLDQPLHNEENATTTETTNNNSIPK